MSKHTSATERGRFLQRFIRRDDGAVAIEFAFIFPALIAFTIGILEFGLILFDFHRASEATRRAGRLAIIQDPLATLDTLRTTNLAIDCTATSGGVVSCTDNTDNGDSDTSFAAMITTMQGIFPDIGNINVQVGYVASGIDATTTPELVTALVTVSLTGVTHSFVALGIIPGVPSSMTFPAFSTSVLRATEVITPP